jgi:D-alanyl-lipoteichoic acid acyltransferase DltB (MBOAT superfamily)
MENFEAPYLSTSVASFWRKWHISLTSWFKDYLYIPLGGSRKGKVRKYVNKMIVFLVSGLWHGASFAYVIWGGLNGLYQIIGEALMPVRNKLVEFFHLHRNSLGHKLFNMLGTFFLVDFSWIFFRAGSMEKSIRIIKAIFSVKNPWVLFDGSIYNCGLDIKNYWLMITGICVLLFADIFKHKRIAIRAFIASQDYWVRCLVIDAAVIVLVVFGIWGSTYDAANFIYFQF